MPPYANRVALVYVAKGVSAYMMSVAGVVESDIHYMVVSEACACRPLARMFAHVEVGGVFGMASSDNSFLALVYPSQFSGSFSMKVKSEKRLKV